MWPALVSILTGPVLGKIADSLNNWQDRAAKRAEAKLEAELATIRAQTEMALKRAESEAEWDAKALANSDGSWKDEYVLVLFSFPLIGLFVPGLQDYVAKGFMFMNQSAPDWFFKAWAVMIGAIYGSKKFVDVIAGSMDRRHARETAVEVKKLDIKDLSVKD